MVGREHELACMADAIDRLMSGQGQVIWLEGEPGIGKPTLLDELVAAATRREARVFRAEADELSRQLPLRVAASALGVLAGQPDGARAELADLIRGDFTGDVLDPVLAAVERMLELVDQLCAADPVVLIMEDLQWADGPSLSLWHQLSLAIGQLPLVLVGTCGLASLSVELSRSDSPSRAAVGSWCGSAR